MTTSSGATQVDADNSGPDKSPAHDAGKRIELLSEEQRCAVSDEQRALLCFESAVTRERIGDQAGAAKDYLASYNANPSFREPVEALTVLLERRKSMRNIGRLLETLASAATTSAQAARAQLLRGAHLAEHDNNLDEARAAFEQAVEEQPDLAAGWLELEIIGGKTSDADLRLHALQQRARVAEPSSWKALLLLDIAAAMESRGDFDAAVDTIVAAAQLDSPFKYRAFAQLEAIAAREKRYDLLADALLFQAELVFQAMNAQDDSRDNVPSTVQTEAHLADLFVRASHAKTAHGDVVGAGELLDKAMNKLPDNGSILLARFEIARLLHDVALAATLARRLLQTDPAGPVSVALWMAVFDDSAEKGDREEAITALNQALACDGASVPARALQVDLLIDADPAAYATAIEAMAERAESDEGKAQVYLIAAWAWAACAKDVLGAKAALAQAAMLGAQSDISQGVVARLARALASAIDDTGWFEEATKRLATSGASPNEYASLWFELARSRLLRRDAAAAAAVDSLAQSAGGEWLGHALQAYVLDTLSDRQPAPGDDTETDKAYNAHTSNQAEPNALRAAFAWKPLDALASTETEPVAACALSVVAAMRRLEQGDRQGALEKLRQLYQEHRDDLTLAVLLADAERAAGDDPAAAAVLIECAAAVENVDHAELSVALRLEGALLLWRCNQRDAAIEQFRIAKEQLPQHAVSLLLWALAARDPDSLASRREMLEAGEIAGVDRVGTALMRFAVESTEGGDEDAARQALDILESEGVGGLRVGAWLGRLIQPSSFDDVAARDRALDGIEELGLRASSVVAAERYRMASREQSDTDAALGIAHKWAMTDGAVGPAIEWLAASAGAQDVASQANALRLIARHAEVEARSALNSQAAMLELVNASEPIVDKPFGCVPGRGAAAQLANLELAPAGCDPRRRAKALLELTDDVGTAVGAEARGLAGWSLLAVGQVAEALTVFREVCAVRPDDLVAWEGVRTAAETLGDVYWNATACERLGDLCSNNQRAAEFYETAGLLWIDQANDPQRGEAALQKGFERDGRRFVCFDRLFRRVRAREDNEYLLKLIARRLQFAEDTAEIGKMFWERARVLRQKGDFEAAMAALESVTMLEPDHVGALALSGEMYIREQKFEQAAEKLSTLAALEQAPQQQRLVSGMAAVDLYEHRLNNLDKALEVLTSLHTSGLSTLAVRERLAKVAVADSAWPQAVEVLEALMHERSDVGERLQAASLAMEIRVQKLDDIAGAFKAVHLLLSEAPADPKGLDVLLTHTSMGQGRDRAKLLDNARAMLVERVSQTPNATDVALLARIASEQRDIPLRQVCLGASIVLGCAHDGCQRELDELDRRIPPTPQVVFDAAVLARVSDPHDTGPLSQLFIELGPVITEALGPTLAGLEVTKRDRIDARDGVALRNDVAHWAGAFGISDFDLYVGGRTPKAVIGVSADRPMLVVGKDITSPLSPYARQAIARELFAIRRGISVVRTRDKATVASIVVGLCNILGVEISSPPYAMLAETQRLIGRALPRRLKRPLTELCQAVASARQDPAIWYDCAVSSLDRMALIAAADVSLVLADALDLKKDQLPSAARDSARAKQLVAFALSDGYLALRKQLGMGVR